MNVMFDISFNRSVLILFRQIFLQKSRYPVSWVVRVLRF